MKRRSYYFAVCLTVTFVAIVARGQGTSADYERAQGLQSKFQSLAINLPGPTNWIPKTNHFWYRRTVKGGSEIIRVDAESLVRRPAFDHVRLAASLSAAAGENYTALRLPLGAAANLNFADAEQKITFVAANSRWECTLTDYKCTRLGPAPGNQ
jgi:hypothetical protein